VRLQAALAELERRWAGLGVPVEQVLNPGADPAAVAEALRQATGVASQDVVTWFAWHNGPPLTAQWDAQPIGRRLLPVDDCLRKRQWLLDMNDPAETEDGVLMPQWQEHWLPLTEPVSNDYVAVDLLTGEVLDVDYWNAEFVTTAAFDLELAVGHCLRALGTDAYRWEQNRWTVDRDAVPADLRVPGLVD
jgi:hypothetical protein